MALYVNGMLYDRSVEDHYTELTEREEKDYARAEQSSQTSVFPGACFFATWKRIERSFIPFL